MKLLLDMNLAPGWVRLLEAEGIDAVHWSTVGKISATDMEVIGWAREHERVVVTHDLGFSALLAMSRTTGPSIILLRIQDLLLDSHARLLAGLLRTHRDVLQTGAILSVDDTATRMRILPVGPSSSDAS